MNKQYENKLIKLVLDNEQSQPNQTTNHKVSVQDISDPNIPYSTVMNKLEMLMLESRAALKIVNKDMVSFIKVRLNCVICGMTQTYKDIPSR